MSDDVVAALDRWLVSRASLREATVSHAFLQRARDEIVALRRTIMLGPDLPALARAEALEEAARIAQNGCLVPPDGGSPTEEERKMCEHIAAAIRAMKEEH